MLDCLGKVCAFFVTLVFVVYYKRNLRICMNEGRDTEQGVAYFLVATGCAMITFVMMVASVLSVYNRQPEKSFQGYDVSIHVSNAGEPVWKIGLRDGI
ncbi:hypothetical protein [Acetobacter pasteurianus]|uniref:hypothetical protein n=1 Tax=Acetobacter pasteurianus TaxID=438 RepID=UPI00136696F2|nr:hypothetical protein [Acetobacter pasteurianus]QHM90152.1 hypothetical protein FCN51_00715 [Acetobacter pasteurianus]